MQQYQFNTTIEKEVINIPDKILEKISSNVNVIIQFEDKDNLPADITLASEKSLGVDWLSDEEDAVWQNL